jgi:hypothetical protein
METNTINLSVEDYNEMRDFNEAIKKKECIRIYWSYNSSYESEIYSTEQIVKQISEINIELRKKIEELTKPKYDEIKKMTWWQLIKFKRSL